MTASRRILAWIAGFLALAGICAGESESTQTSALEPGFLTWKTRDGRKIQAQLTDFRMDSKNAVFELEDGRAIEVPGRELNLLSKARLFNSLTYQKRLADWDPVSESGKADEKVLKDFLVWMGLVMLTILVSKFAFGWVMISGWGNEGRFGHWLMVFAFMTLVSAFLGVANKIAQFNAHLDPRLTELNIWAVHLGAEWLLHALILAAFYKLKWWAPFVIPVFLMFVTVFSFALGLGIPLYRGAKEMSGEVSWATIDTYLTEAWLVPIGLL